MHFELENTFDWSLTLSSMGDITEQKQMRNRNVGKTQEF